MHWHCKLDNQLLWALCNQCSANSCKRTKKQTKNKLKPSSASAEIFIYCISRQPISAIAERHSTPGHLSQALTVHYYMARGLICTSVLRLTLQSYKKKLCFVQFSFFLFKNQDTRFFAQVIIYKFTFFVCCVAIVSPRSCKNVLSSDATLHTAEPHCKRCVPTADHGWRSLRQSIFCASSETNAPPELWRQKSLSAYWCFTWRMRRKSPPHQHHKKGKNKNPASLRWTWPTFYLSPRALDDFCRRWLAENLSAPVLFDFFSSEEWPREGTFGAKTCGLCIMILCGSTTDGNLPPLKLQNVVVKNISFHIFSQLSSFLQLSPSHSH